MTRNTAIEATGARAAARRALHASTGLLVMPNAWDAASAEPSVHAIDSAVFNRRLAGVP